MTEDEARKVARALGAAQLFGEAHPVDARNPGGPWCIRHQGEDVTLAALDALIHFVEGDANRSEPGWHDGRPVRGFVFPEHGRG